MRVHRLIGVSENTCLTRHQTTRGTMGICSISASSHIQAQGGFLRHLPRSESEDAGLVESLMLNRSIGETALSFSGLANSRLGPVARYMNGGCRVARTTGRRRHSSLDRVARRGTLPISGAHRRTYCTHCRSIDRAQDCLGPV